MCFFIRPSDLSHSHGVLGQFDAQPFTEAIARTGEAAQKHGRILGILWFAPELGNRNVARKELRDLAAMSRAPAQPARHLGLELLWWDPDLPAEQAVDELPLHWTAGGMTPLAVMRSAGNAPQAAYVAVKGGSADPSHAHMTSQIPA